MKKILIVVMLCLMSAITFGEVKNRLILRGCYAHLMIVGASVNGWRPITVYHAYGSTCAIAMQRAREASVSPNLEVAHFVNEGDEPVVDEEITLNSEVAGEN